MKFIFFGTPIFAVTILEELKAKGLTPSLIVTQPAKPQGRKLILTDSPVFSWANQEHIPVITPERLKENNEFLEQIRNVHADCFVVAAYGKILRKELLDIPPHGTLNVHPSLLPKFRGPSPVESAILSNETETGVSIMLLDEDLDHGPILAQTKTITKEWPEKGSILENQLAHEGGSLLAEVLIGWINGNITAKEQDHSIATHTKKIQKQDGLILLDGDPSQNLKKIRAFDQWPGAFFFTKRGNRDIRVRITAAHVANGKLIIERVIPEGKHEMEYNDFLRG